MSKSTWKRSLNNNIINFKNTTKQRNLLITKNYLGKSLEIYNGQRHIKININKNMLGHKLGEYAPTRKKNNAKKK